MTNVPNLPPFTITESTDRIDLRADDGEPLAVAYAHARGWTVFYRHPPVAYEVLTRDDALDRLHQHAHGFTVANLGDGNSGPGRRAPAT